MNPSPPRLFTPFLYIYLLLNNFSFPRAAVLVQNQSIPSLSFIILFIFYFHPPFLSSSPSSPSACKWFKNTLKLFFFSANQRFATTNYFFSFLQSFLHLSSSSSSSLLLSLRGWRDGGWELSLHSQDCSNNYM